MQSYTTVMKFIGNSATVEASILLAKSNLFHSKPSGVIPVLSCLRWWGGGYYWAINDPIQQLVSTKIGGLIFVGGWIIGRLQYSAKLRQPQNISLLHGSMQEYYGNTHKCCLIIYRNWMAAMCKLLTFAVAIVGLHRFVLSQGSVLLKSKGICICNMTGVETGSRPLWSTGQLLEFTKSFHAIVLYIRKLVMLR